MPTGVDPFKKELDIFKSEVGIAAQNFHSFLEINRLAARKSVYNALNEHAGFWNLHNHAVQLTYFIVLGRIFDTGPDVHGFAKLLKVAEDNLEVFSSEAFRERRIAQHGHTDWLDDRVRDCVPITKGRIKQIRKYLSKYQKQYRSFENVRHRYYAHKICVDKQGQQLLFSQTQIKKIRGVIQALANVHATFEQCYENGRKRRINQPNDFWKDHAERETRKMILKYAGLKH